MSVPQGKFTNVKKTTARSRAVENNTQLREAAKDVKFLVFWIGENSYSNIGIDDVRWPKKCTIPEKLSSPKSGKIFDSGPPYNVRFIVLSTGTDDCLANKEVVLDKFIKSKANGKENISAINTSEVAALNLTQEVRKMDDDLESETSYIASSNASEDMNLQDNEDDFEPDEDPLTDPEVLQYIGLGTPRRKRKMNEVSSNAETQENHSSATENQLNATLRLLTTAVNCLNDQLKKSRAVNAALAREVKFMRESVFTPCRPQDNTNSDVVVTYGENDFNLMTLYGDVPAKFGLAIARFMFDDETLIGHMMEPAPGERGRPALNQASIEKLKQALYARFGKTPIVYDHARRAINQWGLDELKRRKAAAARNEQASQK